MKRQKIVQWLSEKLELEQRLEQALEETRGLTEEEAPPPTLLQWSARLLSLLLLLSLIGYVVWVGLQETVPASFEYRVMDDRISRREGRWVLPVEIRNRGTESVLNLTIRARLVAEDGQTVEEEELQFPLFGAGERATLALWFEADPREHQLRVEIGSYVQP